MSHVTSLGLSTWMPKSIKIGNISKAMLALPTEYRPIAEIKKRNNERPTRSHAILVEEDSDMSSDIESYDSSSSSRESTPEPSSPLSISCSAPTSHVSAPTSHVSAPTPVAVPAPTPTPAPIATSIVTPIATVTSSSPSSTSYLPCKAKSASFAENVLKPIWNAAQQEWLDNMSNPLVAHLPVKFRHSRMKRIKEEAALKAPGVAASKAFVKASADALVRVMAGLTIDNVDEVEALTEGFNSLDLSIRRAYVRDQDIADAMGRLCIRVEIGSPVVSTDDDSGCEGDTESSPRKRKASHGRDNDNDDEGRRSSKKAKPPATRRH
ncbi:hypothetical protein SISSUDRAFT_1065950 [Sistotremastrum suecicum HHB10207 ss-3]|uniref:Uncharacterized protein n=1 Tax=Sistotremastrum suecicum HHB10207 ss-3 TaxID=1314776 RepID=A0A165YWK3_9AGAM|nr:hypothetical protein SISSUDRAFT_1065950 [Sistotremastrum suecicum HHB10207 ss-3]